MQAFTVALALLTFLQISAGINSGIYKRAILVVEAWFLHTRSNTMHVRRLETKGPGNIVSQGTTNFKGLRVSILHKSHWKKCLTDLKYSTLPSNSYITTDSCQARDECLL